MNDPETAIIIILGLLYLLFKWLPPVYDDRREK